MQGRFLPSVEEGVAEDTHRVVQAWTWENGEQVLNSEDEAIETNPVLAALRRGTEETNLDLVQVAVQSHCGENPTLLERTRDSLCSSEITGHS